MSEDGLAARLVEAAAQGGGRLVQATAEELGTWAVLVDPLAGALYSYPQDAAERGTTAATSRDGDAAGTVVVRAGGAELVVGAGGDVRRVPQIADLAAGLFRVRIARTLELAEREGRLHAALVRALLSGRTSVAVEALSALPGPVTLYRLNGQDPRAAHAALWRALPLVEHQRGRVLLARLQREIAVVVLHPPGEQADPQGRLRQVVARAADRFGLAGGVSAADELDGLAVAWAAAGEAAATAGTGWPLVTAGASDEWDLLRIIPPERLAAWSGALLRPLDDQLRAALDTWLSRRGSVAETAAALGVAQEEAYARIARIGELLGADLGQECVRMRLLIALRAWSADPVDAGVEPVDPAVDCLVWLADLADARAWAQRLVHPLTTDRRTELLTWLEHHADTAAAATALGIPQHTLNRHLAEAASALGRDLGREGVRAELYLALVTSSVTARGAHLPQGAPGLGDWHGRSGDGAGPHT